MTDKRNGILLESGTNELEVLVFTLGKSHCGVNVAKVREVVAYVDPVSIPETHPAVKGVINLRGQVITLVDLQLYFHPGIESTCEHRHVIVTEFNDMVIGFIVDGVEQIYRLGWDTVEALPSNQESGNAAVTSICHIEDKLALMIDFEKIAFDIQGVNIEAQEVGEDECGVDRKTRRLLLAEDSPTMRDFIHQTLVKAGYTHVTQSSDGQAAWDELERNAADPAEIPYDLIISDIEMPRMDGLHLCKRLRESQHYRDIPIVIFSSLVSDDNYKKMAAVGADATLTKPQLVKLVQIVDDLILKSSALV